MSTDRRMDKDVIYIHYGILFSDKKNENLPFAATWVDLEGIILSAISKTEENKYCVISLIHGTWKIQPHFSGGTADKSLPANSGDTGSVPGLGRFHMSQSN